MATQSSEPTRRNKIALWVLSILLLFLLAAIVYVVTDWLSAQTEHPGTKQQPAVTEQSHPASFAGPYCYAGTPKPLPTFQDTINILTNTGYLVGYCEARKDPVWVCYRLFTVSSFRAPPRPQGFTVDMRTRAKVSQHDYVGSGYDRGHMAPNYAIAVCYGGQAQLETFLMSNIIPQRPRLNRQVWERLEQEEIRDYAQRFKQVWVIDGPVFGQEAKRLACGVAVPTACFKIIVEAERGQPKTLAFIMPQTVEGTESPGEFLTNVGEIEKETGLDFFSELPKDAQSRMEAETPARMW